LAGILKLRYKMNQTQQKLDITKTPLAIYVSFIDFAIFVKKNNL